MSKFVDYFVVMAYDTQFIPFFAETTCSQSQVYSGLKKYLSMGVPESKLVITLPWYFPVSRCVFRFYGECVTWILSLNYKTQACQSALYSAFKILVWLRNLVIFEVFWSEIFGQKIDFSKLPKKRA